MADDKSPVGHLETALQNANLDDVQQNVAEPSAGYHVVEPSTVASPAPIETAPAASSANAMVDELPTFATENALGASSASSAAVAAAAAMESKSPEAFNMQPPVAEPAPGTQPHSEADHAAAPPSYAEFPLDVELKIISRIDLVKSETVNNVDLFEFQVNATRSEPFIARRSNQDIEKLYTWISDNFPHLKKDLPKTPSAFGNFFSSRKDVLAKRTAVFSALAELIVKIPELLFTWELQEFFDAHVKINAALFPPLRTPEGMLYIRIVGVSELVMPAGKSISPFVRACVAAPVQDKTPGLETDKFPDSTEPKYNTEMVFAVRNRHRPLRFQVWDKNTLSANRLMSHVQFDVSRLLDYTLHNLTLPMNDLCGSQSRVSLVAQFTPMLILSETQVKLADFRFQLPRLEFFVGESFVGQLALNVSIPFSATDVSVQLVAYEETRIEYEEYRSSSLHNHHHHNHHHHNHHKERHTVRHTERCELLRLRALCWNSSTHNNNKAELGSGAYLWNFQFSIPSNLPPSVQVRHGEIKYMLKAKIIRPGALTSNKRRDQPLKILSPYVSSLPQTVSFRNDNTFALRSNNQRVVISASVEGNTISIGQPTLVRLTIANTTTSQVKDLTLSLRGRLRIQAQRHVDYRTIFPFTISSKDGFPIMPNSTKELSVIIMLPDDVPPSLPLDFSPLIQLSYTMHISCGVSGFLTGPAENSMNIIVSHVGRPLGAVNSVALPQYPQQQPALDLINSIGAGLPIASIHAAANNTQALAPLVVESLPPRPEYCPDEGHRVKRDAEPEDADDPWFK